MPEYKDVNKSDMLKYLNMIEEMVLECKHHFSFAALFAIIIAAYEYCLCYSYFYLNTNVTALNGQKVTQGHIYGFLSSKKPRYDYHDAYELFMRTRHSIAHLSPEYFYHDKVRLLLNTAKFYELLAQLEFSKETLESLKSFTSYLELPDTPQKLDF